MYLAIHADGLEVHGHAHVQHIIGRRYQLGE